MEFADSIEHVDPDAWDRVVEHSSFYMSRSYRQVLERAGPKELGHRYAVVLRGNTPVAAVAAQIIGISGEQLAKAQEEGPECGAPSIGDRVRNMALRFMDSRVVLCGNLFSTGPDGVAVAPGADPAQVWPSVIEALERIRDAEPAAIRPAGVFFKDMPSGSVGERVLRDSCFHRVATGPDMALDIRPEWKCYEDYLSALRAKYRKAARNVFEAVENSGGVVEVLQDLEGNSEALHALYTQVVDQAQAHFVSLPPTYFPALAKAAGDRFRCTVLWRHDALLGFMTTLRDGETLAANYCGFDYAVKPRIPVYFRLLHTIIADAIESGCRRISFGRTTLEPKRRLGAVPAPMAGWLRHRNPFINFAIWPLARMISHEEAPECRPFKGCEGAKGVNV